MPTFTPDGVPVYAEWPQEAKDALYAQFKMLDPQKEGLDRSKLRVFYPYLGWNDIQKGLEGLIADGKVQSSIGTLSSGKPVELFTWKGV